MALIRSNRVVVIVGVFAFARDATAFIVSSICVTDLGSTTYIRCDKNSIHSKMAETVVLIDAIMSLGFAVPGGLWQIALSDICDHPVCNS